MIWNDFPYLIYEVERFYWQGVFLEGPMFLGEYIHSIDNKFRMVIPPKFHEGLGQRFVITRGLDKCLFAFSMTEWQKLYDKIKSLSLTDKDTRFLDRFFFGRAAEAEPDTQRRVMLPLNLREYAEINKEIVSVGLSNRVEIWSRENWSAYDENWAEYHNKLNDIDSNLAEKMSMLGI